MFAAHSATYKKHREQQQQQLHGYDDTQSLTSTQQQPISPSGAASGGATHRVPHYAQDTQSAAEKHKPTHYLSWLHPAEVYRGPQLPTDRSIPGIPCIPQLKCSRSVTPPMMKKEEIDPAQAYMPRTFPVAPQSLGDMTSLKALPDAPHRQAWSSQPTFRWFKRSTYGDVPDRWCKTGPKFSRTRGDNYYRPQALDEQAVINARIIRRLQTRGLPRLGEW